MPGKGRLFFTMAILKGIWKMQFTLAIICKKISQILLFQESTTDEPEPFGCGTDFLQAWVECLDLSSWLQSLAHHLDLGA